jgi:hypothetical protein
MYRTHNIAAFWNVPLCRLEKNKGSNVPEEHSAPIFMQPQLLDYPFPIGAPLVLIL